MVFRMNANLQGVKFKVPEYECVWECVSYHRGSNWICREPDHATTCEFHEAQIFAGIADLEALERRHAGQQTDDDDEFGISL